MQEMEKVSQSNSRNGENIAEQSGQLRVAANSLRLNAVQMHKLVLGRQRKDPTANSNTINPPPSMNLPPEKEKRPSALVIKDRVGNRPADNEVTSIGSIERKDSRWNAA